MDRETRSASASDELVEGIPPLLERRVGRRKPMASSAMGSSASARLPRVPERCCGESGLSRDRAGMTMSFTR